MNDFEQNIKGQGKLKITTESERIDKILATLSDDEFKKNLLFKSVWAGAKVLQGTTKQYFRNKMGESAMHYSKYIKAPFEDGITVKGDKAYCEARVSIMKDFRLKFFEKGTEDRYIKKSGHSDLKRGRHNNTGEKSQYRGRITPKHFFLDARNDSTNNINEVMEQAISNELNKL